jgi:hypothetical protein
MLAMSVRDSSSAAVKCFVTAPAVIVSNGCAGAARTLAEQRLSKSAAQAVRARPFHRNFPKPLPSTLDEITNGRWRAAALARPPRCRSPPSGGEDVPRLRIKFPQPDCRGKTRRPGPDNHDVVLHPLARRPILAHNPSADLFETTIEDLHKNGSALLPCDERLAR